MQRHPVQVPFLFLDVVLLDEHEHQGPHPEQHADPATCHSSLYQPISEDSLVAGVIGKQVLFVPIAKIISISIHVVVMQLLVNYGVSKDCPENKMCSVPNMYIVVQIPL